MGILMPLPDLFLHFFLLQTFYFNKMSPVASYNDFVFDSGEGPTFFSFLRV
jgi:hypothetical protein